MGGTSFPSRHSISQTYEPHGASHGEGQCHFTETGQLLHTSLHCRTAVTHWRHSKMAAFLDVKTPDNLQPLTQWRQQHRRTKDGHLCAAAGVSHNIAFTGCTDMPSPDGDTGQAWCYIEPQLLETLPAGTSKWNYCAPLAD